MRRWLPFLVLFALPALAQPARAELWLGGDMHLDRGGRNVLGPLRPALDGALGVVNFEGAVSPRATREPRPGEKRRLFQHPGVARELAAAGVRVVSVANNHARDDGEAGLRRTREALGDAGILAAGDAHVAHLTHQGLRIAIAAFELTPHAPASMAEVLRDARAGADVLVVSLHVTGPALYLPRPPTRAAVEHALAAGASVVVVHGSHALGPVERRGHAVVAWGLGNLAFACRCTQEREALVLRVALSRDGVDEARVLPVRAGLDGSDARLAPTPEDTFALLESLGSSPLTREGEWARF